MPKFEPKQIQKDLESGKLWPVYWIYGQERMKSRELLKRIRNAVLGSDSQESSSGGSLFGGFAEENLDGTEVSAPQIIDAAQSLSLGGSVRFIVIREAHAIKESEQLSALLGPQVPKDQLTSVCVFLSKDLDGRKKFSKLLTEKAAVIPCEEIADDDREAWIQYLAKRRTLDLAPELVVQLRTLDPWSLDIIDQELEKYQVSGEQSEVLMGGSGSQVGGDVFIDAFLNRNLKISMQAVESFAESPDESLPLLGLLAWNVRYLALVSAHSGGSTKNLKLNPFLVERLGRWSKKWRLEEVLELQSKLAELDFGMKQTARMSLGLWTSLVTDFCSPAPSARHSD